MSSDRLNFIILGASGFVGGSILEELRNMHDCPVQGFRSSDLDLNDPHSAERLCQVLTPETVLIVTARAGLMDAFEGFSAEASIALNVAKALAVQRLRKCIYFSSVSVYGDATTNMCITENTPINPTSFYGAAKYAGECVLRQIAQDRRIPLIVFRPCKIYGPGDSSKAYGPVGFIESILHESKASLFGDGRELRDHIFIGDVARITVDMARGDQQGTFNLVSGESCSFKDILEIIRKVSGREFEIVNMKRTRPKIDQKFCQEKMARVMPGFRPMPLEQGVAETYRFVLKKTLERT